MTGSFPDLTTLKSLSVHGLPGFPMWIFSETVQDYQVRLGYEFSAITT